MSKKIYRATQERPTQERPTQEMGVYVTGSLENQAVSKLPRQFANCLVRQAVSKLPRQLPRQFNKIGILDWESIIMAKFKHVEYCR